MSHIKIVFDGPNSFTNGSKYTFIHISGSDKFDAIYSGKSRIDGHDIFQIITSTHNYPIYQYTINGNTIKKVDLIKALEDNIPRYSVYEKNKEILFGYIVDHYKIQRDDLKDDDKFKIIMRDIILKDILPG